MRSLLLTVACCAAPLLAQQPLNSSSWAAKWIDAPGSAPHDYGVYHFRRTFELPSKPASLWIMVSADNRYELFVNGKQASHGPASGDPYHWIYESVDIGPLLVNGRNTLAAVVWNDGKDRALAFHSVQTGFLLQDGTPQLRKSTGFEMVNTNSEWRTFQDLAYMAQTIPADQRAGYYVAPPNEHFDASKYPWGWQNPGFDDSQWKPAQVIGIATNADAPVEFSRWRLFPRQIPMDEQKPQQFAALRDASPGAKLEIIPPRTKAWFLLDQGELTTAYPQLEISGGRNARVELHYSEALYVKKVGGLDSIKGNRNDVAGKTFYGPHDTYIADGAAHRVYSTLYWRTFRYVRVEVETQDEALTIHSLNSIFSAYPFQRKATFEVDAASNAEIQKILETGLRTARLCAHETYMDCPFYEQLQYAGDARIQMLVSLYMTGDARLMKNGISQIDATRLPEGITYSRAPSASPQFIPGFSLWWIGMVHDYMMYVDDLQFVRAMLPGVRAVLSYFAIFQKPDGSMNALPWWNFADWVPRWNEGIPPADPDGSSTAIFDLQLALAYRWAADIERVVGNAGMSSEYAAAAEKINQTVYSNDWDAARQMLADQPAKSTYSQHANTLAILSGAIPAKDQAKVLARVLAADDSVAQSTIYFRAYTNAALRDAGLGNRYLEQLTPWRRMLADGLSTWAETDGNTRSDCHAWGASPNYELLRTVAGIDSMAPAFAKVRIAPNPGELKSIKARMPHPHGEIAVDLHRQGDRLTADVALPEAISGEFIWRGTTKPLKPGANHLTF